MDIKVFCKRYLKKCVLWALVIAWMSCIFVFSAQPAKVSSKTSMAETNEIVSAINPKFDNLQKETQINELAQFDKLFRKIAHNLLYFVLAILVMAALSTYKIKLSMKMLLTLGINLLYGASDEIHQIFVAGRGPLVTDVLLDVAGAAVGILVFILFAKIFKAIIKRKAKAVI